MSLSDIYKFCFACIYKYYYTNTQVEVQLDQGL